MSKIKNYLLGYENMYIMQDNEMFNFSLDSILLANFVTINKTTKKILDIGTGNAPIPLVLSRRTDAEIIGVEVQEKVFTLAVESVQINNLNSRIKIINEDINDISKIWSSEMFDIITCNPPYFRVKDDSNLNISEYKTIARHEIMLDLERLFKISKKLLKNNGIISIVHRPERMVDIIQEMKKNNIEPKKICLIYPKVGREANILLIEGRKNGNPGIKIMDPIYSHQENGEYTNEIKKYFKER